MNLTRYSAKEYGQIHSRDGELDLTLFRAQETPEWKNLGVQLSHENGIEVVMASHFIGQVWLDRDTILTVTPKYSDASPLRMYCECLRHLDVAEHLDRVLFLVFDEPLIPDHEDVFTSSEVLPLLIVAYLRHLYELCLRHLRVSFTMTEANLVGKVRGQPRIHKQVIMNSFRAREDRMFCRFQVGSLDNPVNQILRAALEKGCKYLFRMKTMDPGLYPIAGFCLSSLRDVTLRRIDPREFQGLILGTAFAPYRIPFQFARLILNTLGNDPHEVPDSVSPFSLPPFVIDMNELFERYCEALLRNHGYDRVWVGDAAKEENLGKEFKVRPDFLVRSNDACFIVDSKYKDGWDWRNEGHRGDVFQVMTYALHDGVRKELYPADGEVNTNSKLCVVVLYPDGEVDQPLAAVDLTDTGVRRSEPCRDFSLATLEKYAIPLPRRSAKG